MIETATATTDVVPLQPAHIWDIGLAVLRHFGHLHVNIIQKACTFLSAILSFAVRIS
jgi:hypothetical protein